MNSIDDINIAAIDIIVINSVAMPTQIPRAIIISVA